jgi:hypothetical protein
VASLLAGAFEAAHEFAHEGRADVPCASFVAAAVLLELAALTVTFELGLRRRRGGAWSFALAGAVAGGLGVAGALAGWVIQRASGIAFLGNGHPWTTGKVVELGLFDGLLGLGLWAIAVVFPFAVSDANARALEAERLRTVAELARLRAHLQPHFLLNTLNTVAGLVGEDPREARNIIGALGDLLRDSLEETDEMQTIEDEVKWLRRYAGILETRHRGVLTFRWDIAEATRGVRVPRLLLQPLLENAVQHGALRRREGGEVAIRTTIDPGGSGRVTCVVEDNGPGPGARAPRSGALGIQLVTRRLAAKYAGAAAFRLESEGGLTRSIVEIPAEATA